MRPDAILFDLDGTLLDHDGAVRAALDVWLPTLSGAATSSSAWTTEHHDAVVAAWFDAETRHFTRWRTGEVSFAEQRRARLRDVLPVAGQADAVGASDDELDALFSGYLAAYEGSWRLFDDVIPALESLQHSGFRLAMLTNGTEEQQGSKVERTGLGPWLETVFTAEGLGVAKPSADAFRLSCEALDVAPDRILYVGDNPVVDVRGALDAGLGAVHLDRPGTNVVDPAQRIRSLTELPARLG